MENENINKQDNLLSRRKFFKKTFCISLPFIGLMLSGCDVVKSSLMNSIGGYSDNYSGGYSGGSSYGCGNYCTSSCYTLCTDTCKTQCTETCRTVCTNTCKGYCVHSSV